MASMNRRSVLYRSLIANPGTGFYMDPGRVYARNLEAPSGGGVGTARAIAKAYGVFAGDGGELGLRPETSAIPVRSGRQGRVARWATPTRRPASATAT
jgi:hypothetical protein